MHKTPVTDERAVKEYAAARLLGNGQDIRDLESLRSFTIWAGRLHEELPNHIRRLQPVDQDFPREPIILNDGEGHVAVSDGFSRVGRYENMLDNLSRTEGMAHLQTIVAYLHGSVEATHERFRSFAENFSRELLEKRPSIDTLFIGPLRNVTDGLYAKTIASRIDIPKDQWNDLLEMKANHIHEQFLHSGRNPPGIESLLQDNGIRHLAASEAIHGDYKEQALGIQERLFRRSSHPYCDYLFFDENKAGVNYMYGDQIEYFLSSFLPLYAEKNGSFPRIIMHGKVGGLEEDTKRGDIIIPKGVLKNGESYSIQQPLVLQNDAFAHYGTRCHTGGNVFGVDYVLEQTLEDLEAAKETCSCTEMEFYHACRAVEKVSKETGIHQPMLHFIGYVSDVPLQGDTLAKELTDYRGIYRALQQVIQRG